MLIGIVSNEGYKSLSFFRKKRKNTKNHHHEDGKRVQREAKNYHHENGKRVPGRRIDGNVRSGLNVQESIYKNGNVDYREQHDVLLFDGKNEHEKIDAEVNSVRIRKKYDTHTHAVYEIAKCKEVCHGPNASLNETFETGEKDEEGEEEFIFAFDLLDAERKKELIDYESNNRYLDNPNSGRFYKPYLGNNKDPKKAEEIAKELDRVSFMPRHNCTYCSWWYHERCLQGEEKASREQITCSYYTEEEHTCATCTYFDNTPGSNGKGDSWYGICEGYGGNPIRYSPDCHTCKNWTQ